MPRKLALAVALTTAFAVVATEPYKPEYVTINGTVKEINVSKNGLTFKKTVDGPYGRQEVTDYRKLGEKCLVSVDGVGGRLSDLRPGYLVLIEYEKKTEIAVRVAATTPETAAREQKRKEEMTAFERKIADEQARVLRKAAEGIAAEQKTALEKAMKKRTEKMKAQPNPEPDKDKGVNPPKDGEKKD